MSDPFDDLATPVEPESPRPAFARQLRARLVAELGLTIDVPPPRRTTMTTTTSTTTAGTTPAGGIGASLLTAYLSVHDAAAAIDFYAQAFGADERARTVMDDGRIGHAELAIGAVSIFLADEFPEADVRSPASLGGSGVSLHLQVADVDSAFARAVAAGATTLADPADQPHGARHGTLRDPFGHRWILSSPLPAGVGPRARPTGGIWAALNYRDARAGIRFLVDVLGFEERLVVADDADPDVVVHSQLVWPEGGTVQAGSAGRPGNVFSARPVGAESLYVITADPMAVWERCQRAGVEVVHPPESPEYDPDGTGFSIRDPEGNLWSFGTYAGEA